MEGGITWGDFRFMRKKDFYDLLEWLHKQKKRENDEIEKTQGKHKAPKVPTGKMKYLGL